jgi:hypothetical protein
VSVFSSRCVATLMAGCYVAGHGAVNRWRGSTAQTPQNRFGGDRSNDVPGAILD